jgi:predicted membrane protein
MKCGRTEENQLAKRIFWGVVLVVAGALLLAKNLDLLPFTVPAYIFSWKMLLIVLGASFVVSGRFGGLVPMAIGGYFLLPEAFGIPVPQFQKLWPVIFIFIGLGVLFKRNSWRKKKEFYAKLKYKIDSEQIKETKEDTMEATAVFGGESKKVSSYDFKGGKCTAIFGGLELDLTNCYLSSERGVIDVNVVFGGMTLRVPKEWNVRSEIVPVMGGVEDKIYYMKDTYVDPAAELVLRGSVVMGAVEILRD